VVGGLGEAGFDSLRDVPPVGVGYLHVLRVLAFFPREGAEEGDDVVGDVVLHRAGVADDVDVAHGGADETEVRVCF